MGHQLKLKELQEWLKDKQLVLYASSSDKGVLKRLYATLHGSFEIHVNNKEVWSGSQPFDAVEKYNEI